MLDPYLQYSEFKISFSNKHFKVLLSPHGHYFIFFADGTKNHIDSGFKIDYQAEICKTLSQL